MCFSWRAFNQIVFNSNFDGKDEKFRPSVSKFEGRTWMKKTFLLLEFRSIGTGFIYLDEITKNFNVKIEKTGILCPGKYMIVCSGIQGEIGSLDSYLDTLKDKYLDTSISKILVSGVSVNILEKLNKSIEFNGKKAKSLGLIEFSNSIRAIEIADFLEDESPVEIITIRIGVGMCNKGIVFFKGDTSAVKNSVIKVKQKNLKELISAEVINSPSENFLEVFKI